MPVDVQQCTVAGKDGTKLKFKFEIKLQMSLKHGLDGVISRRDRRTESERNTKRTSFKLFPTGDQIAPSFKRARVIGSRKMVESFARYGYKGTRKHGRSYEIGK